MRLCVVHRNQKSLTLCMFLCETYHWYLLVSLLPAVTCFFTRLHCKAPCVFSGDQGNVVFTNPWSIDNGFMKESVIFRHMRIIILWNFHFYSEKLFSNVSFHHKYMTLVILYMWNIGFVIYQNKQNIFMNLIDKYTFMSSFIFLGSVP